MRNGLGDGLNTQLSYANDFQLSGPTTAVKQRLILEPIKENSGALVPTIQKSRNSNIQLSQGKRKA